MDEDKYNDLSKYIEELSANPSLNKINEIYKNMIDIISLEIKIITDESSEKLCLIMIKEDLTRVIINVSFLIKAIEYLLYNIDTIIKNTEFIDLYNEKRNLFSIGYDVEKEKITNSYYDL